MRWLLKRALLIWLALIALCAAGVGIGKLDRTPDALQTLGFDVCDGEPCFRGIKHGMSWEEARKRYPNAVTSETFLEFPIGAMNVDSVRVFPSANNSRVESIVILSNQLPITLGEVVIMYGTPCRVNLDYEGNIPGAIHFLYPTLNVLLDFHSITFPHGLTDFQPKLDTPISEFSIDFSGYQYSNNCESPIDEYSGAWYGFASIESYKGRYSSRSDIAQP